MTYPAEDTVIARPVALSVLRGPAAADAEFVAAVREQAYRLAKPACEHPALLRVYDVGVTDQGIPFIAVEAVAGRSLRAALDERGVLDLHAGLRLAIQIGEALETLHASGIVHGELRPESVILVRDDNGGEAGKLIDVALTGARRTSGVAPRDPAIAAYLAPEQRARMETTEASDIYSLGVLILELLTGHRPHGERARGAAELPAPIARIVAKALEDAPGRRYSGISLMINDMWSAESAPLPSAARAEKSSAPGERKLPTRRAPRSDVGMAIALVVGLIVVGLTAWIARSDRLARSIPSEDPNAAVSSITPPQVQAPPAPISAPSPSMPTAPPVAAQPSAPVASEAAPSVPAPAREMPTVVAKPPASNGIAVPAVRPGSRPPGRSTATSGAVERPTTDGADGTAIIDWLLKGERSGG